MPGARCSAISTTFATQPGRGFGHVVVLTIIRRTGLAFGGRDQQILEGQFQLFDLALDLFRRLAEHLLLQLGDAQSKRLDQLVVGPQRG